jgi:hypothetical protein
MSQVVARPAARPGHELKQDRNLIQDGEDLQNELLRNTAPWGRRNKVVGD